MSVEAAVAQQRALAAASATTDSELLADRAELQRQIDFHAEQLQRLRTLQSAAEQPPAPLAVESGSLELARERQALPAVAAPAARLEVRLDEGGAWIDATTAAAAQVRAAARLLRGRACSCFAAVLVVAL